MDLTFGRGLATVLVVWSIYIGALAKKNRFITKKNTMPCSDDYISESPHFTGGMKKLCEIKFVAMLVAPQKHI